LENNRTTAFLTKKFRTIHLNTVSYNTSNSQTFRQSEAAAQAPNREEVRKARIYDRHEMKALSSTGHISTEKHSEGTTLETMLRGLVHIHI